MNYRSIGQLTLTLFMTLSLNACLTDSGDDEALSLAITDPVSLSTMDTTDAAVNLAGTASSGTDIARVSWENDRGGEGVATGTDLWQTGKIDLKLGENTILITAEDTSGATTGQSIRVNRESGQKSSTTLSWTAPTTRTDGSPLANLDGYKIYYGRMSGIYDYQIEIDNPGVVTYVVEDLVSGDWYFALAAYDAEGLESDRSNEVLREIG